jgi:hypothetical protein
LSSNAAFTGRGSNVGTLLSACTLKVHYRIDERPPKTVNTECGNCGFMYLMTQVTSVVTTYHRVVLRISLDHHDSGWWPKRQRHRLEHQKCVRSSAHVPLTPYPRRGSRGTLLYLYTYIHLHIPLTLYSRRGSKGISDISLRHPRFGTL